RHRRPPRPDHGNGQPHLHQAAPAGPDRAAAPERGRDPRLRRPAEAGQRRPGLTARPAFDVPGTTLQAGRDRRDTAAADPGGLMSRAVATLLSIAIGIGFVLLVLYAWPLIAAYNMVPARLAQAGLSGTAWYGATLLQDFVINLLLALPAAWLLLRLG